MYGKVEKGQKIDISRTRFLEFLLHKCIKYGYKCCEIFGRVGGFCWGFCSLRSQKFLPVGSFWYPLGILGIFVGIGISIICTELFKKFIIYNIYNILKKNIIR